LIVLHTLNFLSIAITTSTWRKNDNVSTSVCKQVSDTDRHAEDGVRWRINNCAAHVQSISALVTLTAERQQRMLTGIFTERRPPTSASQIYSAIV